eukprot:261181_1
MADIDALLVFLSGVDLENKSRLIDDHVANDRDYSSVDYEGSTGDISSVLGANYEFVLNFYAEKLFERGSIDICTKSRPIISDFRNVLRITACCDYNRTWYSFQGQTDKGAHSYAQKLCRLYKCSR